MAVFLPETHKLYKDYAKQYEQDRMNGINSSYLGDFDNNRIKNDYYNEQYNERMQQLPRKVIEELLYAQKYKQNSDNYPPIDENFNQEEQLLNNVFDYIDNKDNSSDFSDYGDPYSEETLSPDMMNEMNKELYKKQILNMLKGR